MSFIDLQTLPLSLELKELMIAFVLEAIDNQPNNVYEFASTYFRGLLNERTLRASMPHLSGHESIFRSNATSVDNIEDLILSPTKSTRRFAVASESWTPEHMGWNKGSVEQASEKNNYQKEILKTLISRVSILRALPEEEIEEIIYKMNKLEVSENDIIISEGEEEEFLFIVQSGTFEIYTTNKIGVTKITNTLYNQGSFGELALLYNTKETGSVRAKSDGVLWCLDRYTFKRIVSENSHAHQERSIEFLSRVSILQSLNIEELAKIAEAIEMKSYEKDAIILNQGESGDFIFFIEVGSVLVTVENEGSPKQVAILEVGGYFGELSLMTNRPRSATIQTLEKTRVGMLHRDSFERLLGPCLDVLERNAGNYDTNIDSIFNS